MSVPGNINPAPPPSSFDNDPDFYEESRWAKLRRRLVQEPLIPFGCLLTCWALFEATKSIRSGDKHRTNRMFRRRIYAQGFTIAAMVAGSFYWETDRAKRKEFDQLSEEKQKQERRDAWIKELEAREEEEEELRRIRDKVSKDRSDSVLKNAEQDVRKKTGDAEIAVGKIRSVLEAGEGRRDGPILSAARGLWDMRR